MNCMTMALLAGMVAALALALASASASAQTVYKCDAGGKISYSERPCAGGKVTPLAPPPVGDPAVAAERLARDKARLARLIREREDKAAAQARGEREQGRAARAADSGRQRCEMRRLKQQWAEQDAMRAGSAQRAAALANARRQGELLAVECPG